MVNARVQLSEVFLGPSLLREREDTLDDFATTFGLTDNRLQRVGYGTRVVSELECVLCGEQGSAERVVDLMRDAGGKRADRREAL